MLCVVMLKKLISKWIVKEIEAKNGFVQSGVGSQLFIQAHKI